MGPAKTIKKVGDYTVASCIGKGRYGVCFLAFDPDGNKVILKRFRPRMWRKNKHANHYEAVILSGLEHPAVPELLGVINNQKGYYFVLEYKDGFTLEQWLFEKKKVFTAEEIYRIGSQIFEVLEYLHSRSVVHGDISAANVLLYLLYSGYGGKGDRPWHEELPLSGEQKEFLRKLMEPKEQFADTGEVRRLFEKNFGRN